MGLGGTATRAKAEERAGKAEPEKVPKITQAGLRDRLDGWGSGRKRGTEALPRFAASRENSTYGWNSSSSASLL